MPEAHSLTAPTREIGMVSQGRWNGTSSQHKSHPAGSLSSSHPGRPPCWIISLAFGLTAWMLQFVAIDLVWLTPCIEYICSNVSRGQILGQNPDKSLRVFLLAIHSHLYSFALKFLFLQTHSTSYSFYSSVTEGKPDRKPYPLP